MGTVNLNDFSTYFLTTGDPSISVSKNGLTFSKAAIIKLEKPEYVKILMNYEGRMMAIVKCEKDDEGAAGFLSPSKKVVSVRWNNSDLISSICEMMNWDVKNNIYRVNAIFDKDQGVLLFDLNTAIITSVS